MTTKAPAKQDPAKESSQPNLPAVRDAMRGVQGLEAEDFLLPKVILMQSTSKWVGEGKARFGEYVNSLTAKPLANTEFVLVSLTKHYEGLRYEGTKPVTEFRTLNKEDIQLEGRVYFPKDGTKASARSVLSAVGLFAGKPMAFNFLSTSYKAGKKLAEFLREANRPIYEVVYKLTANTEKNNKGTFATMDVEEVRPATDIEISAARSFQESFLPHIEAVLNKAEAEEAVPF